MLVYNTCTMRKRADDRLAGHLGTAARLKREEPGRVVLVAGCLPQRAGATSSRGSRSSTALWGRRTCTACLICSRRRWSRRTQRPPATSTTARASAATSPRGASGPFQAWVQIMSGCTNFCSVLHRALRARTGASRSLEDIVAEVEGLAADGVREITLLGQNVNAYGLDLRRGGVRDAPTSPACSRGSTPSTGSSASGS